MVTKGIPDDLSAGRELSLYVVGVAYPNADKSNRQFEVAMCKPGEPVELRREPKNKHDPQAVAVLSARGIQIGYLSADRAGWIGGRLAQGLPIVAVFQEGGTERVVIRLNLAGEQPTLPSVLAESGSNPVNSLDPGGAASRGRGTAGAPPEDDFYPDPEGGEWGA